MGKEGLFSVLVGGNLSSCNIDTPKQKKVL
jgi:hypothetical protein